MKETDSNYIPHVEVEQPKNDIVSHPSHYCDGRKYEPIDVFSNYGYVFTCGNSCKYIVRAGRKDKSKEKEDLEKALFYLEYEAKHRVQDLVYSAPFTINILEVLDDWKYDTELNTRGSIIFQIWKYAKDHNIIFLNDAIQQLKNLIKTYE